MLGKRSRNDTRADRVDSCAALAPSDARGLHAKMVRSLGKNVGHHRIGYSIRSQERLFHEFIRGGECEIGLRSGGSGDEIWPAMLETINPAPPGAITRSNSSNTTALPYRSTASIRSGGAMLGETPAVLITCLTLLRDAASSEAIAALLTQRKVEEAVRVTSSRAAPDRLKPSWKWAPLIAAS